MNVSQENIISSGMVDLSSGPNESELLNKWESQLKNKKTFIEIPRFKLPAASPKKEVKFA